MVDLPNVLADPHHNSVFDDLEPIPLTILKLGLLKLSLISITKSDIILTCLATLSNLVVKMY